MNKLSSFGIVLSILFGLNALTPASALAVDVQADSVGLYLPGSELNALNAKPTFIGATSQKLFFHSNGDLFAYDKQTGALVKISLGLTLPWEAVSFGIIGNSLFFSAAEPGTGQELYVSDGTTQGTALFRDILPGSSESKPSSFMNFGNLLIFSTLNAANTAYEIWRTDGNPDSAHTFKIRDMTNLGRSASAILDGHLYFEAASDSGALTIWRTNGTTASQVVQLTIHEGPALEAFEGWVYFNAPTPTQGNELWRTNGTITEIAFDINPTTADTSWSKPKDFEVMGNMLYFSANDGVHGRELMKFDGTSVTLVKDELLGLSASSPSNLTAFNGKLYYSAEDASGARELYSSDGTEAGTGLLMDVLPGVSVCNQMYDMFCGPSYVPRQLSSDPNLFTEFDGKLLFAASGANGSGNLWAITPPIVTPPSNPTTPAPSDNAQISPPSPPAAVFDFAAQPRVAARGGELTLTGQNMDGINRVKFGEADAEIVERTNLYIKVRSPKLVAGIHNIYVSGSAGSLTWQDALTVAQSPVALECKAGHTARVSKRSAIIKATKLCAGLLVKYPELTTSIRVVSSKSATLKANYFF